MMKHFGGTKEQLYAEAMDNSQVIHPATMKIMNEVMSEIMGIEMKEMPGVPPFYVVTNEERVKGGQIFP